jgi:S1-C subfamily serine protease
MTIASKPSGLGPSDHASFAQSNVPALFAFTGLHEEYHRITDTPDTINFDGAVQIVDLVYRIILDASTYEPGFPFTTATGRKPGENASRDNNDQNQGQSMRGVGVRFGIAPGDYAGNEEGVLIGEVLANLPAEKAGLKKDDLMIRWNDKNLVDVEGWMGMLGQHKPGDEVTIVYKRDGQEFTTKATLVARTTNRQ